MISIIIIIVIVGLNKLIALLHVARETSLEEYRVHSELGVEEGHVTIEIGE